MSKYCYHIIEKAEGKTMSNPNFDPMKKSLTTLRDSLGRLIEDGLSIANGSQALPVDVMETDTAVVVKAGPVLGIQPQDIDVSIVGDRLTIKGEIQPEPEPPEGTYLRRERKFGAFSRTVTIPRPVKADQAAASFKDGMLTITLPKVDDPAPKVINVKPTDS
jgi:HSP20 family protein